MFIFLSPETGWFSGKTTDLHILNQQDTLLALFEIFLGFILGVEK